MRILKCLWLLTIAVLIFSCATVTAGEKFFDPVCGQKVDKDEAIQAEYDGKIYCFCCEDYYGKFEKDPDSFACPCPPGSRDCDHCKGKGG